MTETQKREQTPEVQAAIEKVLADLARAAKAFSEGVRNGARPPKE